MSRSRRGQVFQPRWNLITLNSRIEPKLKSKLIDQIAYLNRVAKRANKAAGYTVDKKPSEWNFIVTLKGNKHTGKVEAFTRSEARSEIKKRLEIPRLPTNLSLEKVNVED